MRRGSQALFGHLPALSALALAISVLGGCVRAYEPPTAQQQHAILKLRRTYEQTPGARLRERAYIDEFQALAQSDFSRVAAASRTDVLLIHPVPAAVRVQSEFYHTESRSQLETYYVQEPRSATESYNCGSGGSYRTCTRSVTQYRSVPKQRWVTRDVDVIDGACEGVVNLAPENGRSYILQYTYQDHEACSLSCFEQQTLAEGKFEQKRCPVAPPK